MHFYTCPQILANFKFIYSNDCKKETLKYLMATNNSKFYACLAVVQMFHISGLFFAIIIEIVNSCVKLIIIY